MGSAYLLIRARVCRDSVDSRVRHLIFVHVFKALDVLPHFTLVARNHKVVIVTQSADAPRDIPNTQASVCVDSVSQLDSQVSQSVKHEIIKSSF